MILMLEILVSSIGYMFQFFPENFKFQLLLVLQSLNRQICYFLLKRQFILKVKQFQLASLHAEMISS